MVNATHLMNFLRYLCTIVLDGNYDNAFYKTLPPAAIECVHEVGKFLAGWLGW